MVLWRSLALVLVFSHGVASVKPKPHPRPPDANTTESLELTEELSTSTSVLNANFGQSIALTSSLLAVSAHAVDPGAVFIYSVSEDDITQTSVLSPVDSDVYSFGQAVAMADSSLFAAAIRKPCITCNLTNATSDPHALIYRYTSTSPSTWTFAKTVEIARKNESAAIQAISIAVTSSTLLVSVLSGPTSDSVTEATLQLVKNSSTVDVQALIAAYGYTWLGGGVAMNGDTALVGDTSSSVAYIIAKPNHTYAVTSVLSSNAGLFGYAVALNDAYAVVSAPKYSNYGAVFVYSVGNAYELTGTLIGSDAIYDNSFFGYSVAISDVSIFVGSPGSYNYDIQNGAVFQFELVNDEWMEVQRYSSVYESASLGVTVAASSQAVLMTVQKSTFESDSSTHHNCSVHYLLPSTSDDYLDDDLDDDVKYHDKNENSNAEEFFSNPVNIVVAAVLIFAVPGMLFGGVWVYRYHKNWLGIKTDTLTGPSLEIPPLPVPSSSDSEAGSPALTTASSLFAKLRALRVSTHPMFEMSSPQQQQNKNPMMQPAVQC